MMYGLLYCKGIQILCATQLLRNTSFLMNVFVKVAVVCQLLWPREICLTAFLERNPNTETPDEYDMRAHFASLRVRLSPHSHTHALLSLYSLISPPPPHHVFCIICQLVYMFHKTMEVKSSSWKLYWNRFPKTCQRWKLMKVLFYVKINHWAKK